MLTLSRGVGSVVVYNRLFLLGLLSVKNALLASRQYCIYVLKV